MSEGAHGPVVVRRRLGAALKELRGNKGFGLDTVARRLEFSSAKLSRLETGQVEPKLRDVRDLLDMYDVPDDLRQRLMHWAQDAKGPFWWHPVSARVHLDLDLYLSVEAEAQSIRMYAGLVPGLLQTEAYARAILTAGVPENGPEQTDELVAIRMRRKAVLRRSIENEQPLVLHVVLDEAGLHRGPPDLIADQLVQLIRCAEGRPPKHENDPWTADVTLQLLPYEAGFSRAISTFAIFEPGDDGVWPVAESVVHVESSGRDEFYDSPGDLKRYEEIWASVVARALDPDESRRRIQRALVDRSR